MAGKAGWAPFLPSGLFMRTVALEYKEVIADILWIQGIQLIARKTDTNTDAVEASELYALLDLATDLDSRFFYPCKAGGIALSILFSRSDLSNALLLKGLKNIPTDWQFPFYIGFNYLYHEHNQGKAVFYMETASRFSDAPTYLPFLVARLHRQGGDPKTAILFLKGVYLTTKDEKMREKIAQRISEIEKGLDL